METETIGKLLEKLDKQQYKDVIRSFSQHNKRLKIPGFTSVERAPLKLVANTARTNIIFRKPLLEEIYQVVLSGIDINLDNDIGEIKKEIPKTKWAGLAAFLLLLDDDMYTAEAEKLIEEYTIEPEHEETPQEIDTSPKIDKKEEKFREKYLKAKAEIADIKTELEKRIESLREAEAENEQLREQKKELEQRCIAYLAQIDALSKEKVRLLAELETARKEVLAAHSVPQPKLELKIFAPGCEDILGKYCEMVPIEFTNATKITMEEALKTYDEIWVFSDVIPFGTFRMLRKWKQVSGDKVVIFQTATDLVDRVEKLMQNR